jgi:hypothetical protein
MAQALTRPMRALIWSILVAVVPWAILLGLFLAHTSVFWMFAMRDPRSAVLIGAVYVGATIYYVLAFRENDWEQTKSGIEGAFIVSAVLLTAVALHWSSIRPWHLMTILWLIAYYGPLLLIPILFRREENLTDRPSEGGRLNAAWRRWLVLRGVIYLGLTVFAFLFAPVMAARWAWPIDALEVRMFLGQPATFAWAGVNVLRGHVLWRRYRLHLIYVAILGLAQFSGLVLIRTAYHWGSLLGVLLPLLFAEWIITPVLFLSGHKTALASRQGIAAARTPRVAEGPGWDPYVRYGVSLLGTTYLAIGILGFIPIEALNPVQPGGVGATYLLRHIAVNWLHNIVHILIGVTGLMAVRRAGGARLWGNMTGVVLLLLFLTGLGQAVILDFPIDQSLLGLVPLNSAGHTFHFATGVIALILGRTPGAPDRRSPEL